MRPPKSPVLTLQKRLALERQFGPQAKLLHATERASLFLTQEGTIVKLFHPDFTAGYLAELGMLRQTGFISRPALLSHGWFGDTRFVQYRFEDGPMLSDMAGRMTCCEQSVWPTLLARLLASLHGSSANRKLIKHKSEHACALVRKLKPDSVPHQYQVMASEIRNHLQEHPGEALLHGDPFFKNIILTIRGPIFIDFEWASVGPRSFDLFKVVLDIGRWWSPAHADKFLGEYESLTGFGRGEYLRDEPVVRKERALIADLTRMGIRGI